MSDLDGLHAAGHVAAIQTTLAALAAQSGVVRDIHDVRVRETGEGEIVNFHGTVDSALSVSDVHDFWSTSLNARCASVSRRSSG